jgi:antitoxin component YwqK of YwqJK toxin-antitoxin module
MKKIRTFSTVILMMMISFFQYQAMAQDSTATSARNYLATSAMLDEAEGIWDMSIVSNLIVSDSLASQSNRSPYGNYLILRAGKRNDFRKSYNVYTIDTSDYNVPLDFQGRLFSTSLPGIYNFRHYLSGGISVASIVNLSPGRMSIEVVYPDTLVKSIFKDDYLPEVGITVTLFGKKRYPGSFDEVSKDGLTISYLDSSYMRVRDKSQATYCRKVKLNPAGIPLDLCTIYNMNGTPVWQSAISYYNPDNAGNDVPYGRCVEWYDNGNRKSVKTYTDGMLNDTVIKWYSNGRYKYVAFYIDDVLNGVYKTWFEDGSPEVDAVFKDGYVKGNSYTIFNEEGQERQVFFESFSNDQMGWPVCDTKEMSLVIENEKMVVTNRSRKAVYAAIKAPFDPKWNYEAECTVAASDCKEELFYGMVFGKSDDEKNFQYFAVNKKGEYVAGQCINGEISKFAEPKITDALNKDGSADTLSVKTWGGMVYYSVNGSDVFNTFRKDLKGDGLGTYISGKGEFIFSGFSLMVNKFEDDADGFEEE